MMIDFPQIAEEAFGFDELYLHQEDVSVDAPEISRFKRMLQTMSQKEGAPLRELNYIFCSDDYLLDMNKQYLQHDYFTDVITFPHLADALCGDVYISTDRVAENALKAKTSFHTELLRVMIHGALHLCGYTDATPEQKEIMRNHEDAYLALF